MTPDVLVLAAGVVAVVAWAGIGLWKFEKRVDRLRVDRENLDVRFRAYRDRQAATAEGDKTSETALSEDFRNLGDQIRRLADELSLVDEQKGKSGEPSPTATEQPQRNIQDTRQRASLLISR
jgi:hypothetical protein